MTSEKGNNPIGINPAAAAWARDTDDSISDIRTILTRLIQGVERVDQTVNSTYSAISNTIAASATTTAFSVPQAQSSYAEISISVPPNKTRVTVVAIGNASILDMTSGGATTSYIQLTVAGSSGREVPASKDAGASVVANILTASHSVSVNDLIEPVIKIQLLLRALSATAYTAQGSNFATLTAIAVFDN